MKVRKVVTGHGRQGSGCYCGRRPSRWDAIPGLGELAFLWNADEPQPTRTRATIRRRPVFSARMVASASS